MNAVCVKCKEWMSPLGEVYATSCGHLYHKTCMTELFDRGSKTMTCPCSSNKIASKNVFRLRPTVPNATDGDEQSALLHFSLNAAQALVNHQKDLLKERDEEFKKLNNKIREQEEVINEHKKLEEEFQQYIEKLNNKIFENEALHENRILDLEGKINVYKEGLEEKEVTISVLAQNTKAQYGQIEKLNNENKSLKENVDSLTGDISSIKWKLSRMSACLLAYGVDLELLELGLSNSLIKENDNNESSLTEHEIEYQKLEPLLPLLPLRFEENQENQTGNTMAMG